MTTYTTTASTPTGSKTDLLKRIKDYVKDCLETESAQRAREKEDLKLQVAEFAWSDAAKAERIGTTSGNMAIPPRPMLHISLTQQPCQLIRNQAEAADLGVSVHPVSELASKEDAEIKEGLYQRIERDSNAEEVRLWALDRATQAGRGFYFVNTQYDEDGDDPFDQEIVIERFYDQSLVFMDPSAQKQDLSDAEYGGWLAWMWLDAFKRKYPNADMTKYEGMDGSDQFGVDIDAEPNWVLRRDEKTAILVAMCYYKEHDYQEIKGKDGRKRIKDVVTVNYCHVSGVEVLEEGEWNGHLIPIVPVIGRELQPFGKEHRFEGIVRPARDGQQAYDYAISAAVEDVGRLSKVPYVGAAGQFEGFEAQWQQANRRNFPYLEYNLKSLDGTPIGPPQPMQIDGNKLGLSLQLAETAKGLVHIATAAYDQTLGESGGRHESGRRTLALQQQADASSSNYLQSLANVSMRYEARVVLDLMPAIYDRPGRVTRVLGIEGEEKTVMLGKPFVMDQNTGRPRAVPPGTQGAKMYDLSKGKYSTAVSVGKSYQTRLQQGQEEFGSLLQNLPPELQVLLLPTYLKFRDSPGSKEASEILTKYRDSKFPGLTGDQDQITPEQLKAQMAGMQQQNQQMQQVLQQAIQKLETEQAKQQAGMFKAQLDHQQAMAELDAKTQDSIRKNATQIAVAQIGAEAKGAQMATEARNEQIALAQEHAFQADQAERQRQHEIQQTNVGMAHDVGMAAGGGTTMTMGSEQGQEQGGEQSQEQNSETVPPAPEPAEGE